MLEVRDVQPDEYARAGEVTALAFEEYSAASDEEPDGRGHHGWQGWAAYRLSLADVAGRVQRATVLVALDNSVILGTATIELDRRIDPGRGPLPDGQAHLRMVAVAPDARGRGVGRLLIAAALDRARAAGKTLMTLHTSEQMVAAQHLYEAMGFRRGPDVVFDDGACLRSYSLAVSG